MNYFKPELLSRCRSLDDDAAEAAAEEWERAIAAYRTRLKAIRSRLPASVRRLLSRYSLHDAKVVSLSFGRKQPRFTLVLRLEGSSSQPGEVLELSYLLVAGPEGGVNSERHPGLIRGVPRPEWILYDEFNLDEERAFFTHSLLLADGVEIEARFHGVRLHSLDEVYVSPLELPEAERTWPLVEVS